MEEYHVLIRRNAVPSGFIFLADGTWTYREDEAVVVYLQRGHLCWWSERAIDAETFLDEESANKFLEEHADTFKHYEITDIEVASIKVLGVDHGR